MKAIEWWLLFHILVPLIIFVVLKPITRRVQNRVGPILEISQILGKIVVLLSRIRKIDRFEFDF